MDLKSGVIINLLNDICNLPHRVLKIHIAHLTHTRTHDFIIMHSFEVTTKV
jgi:hypothetical protein